MGVTSLLKPPVFFSYLLYTFIILGTSPKALFSLLQKVLFSLLPHSVISQRVRQFHRLAVAKRAALELAGEIGNAAAPAVFIGEVVHHLGHGHAGADNVGLDLVAIGFGKHAEMSRFPRLWTRPEKGPFSMVELAKFYGVSTDYLLGLTERKNHPSTELDALHLGDDAIEVLRTGKFNHRLLSELICHKNFQRFMLDAEIYGLRICGSTT